VAQPPPSPLHFEDMPLEEARRMGRDPAWSRCSTHAAKKIQALSTEATRIRFGPEIKPGRMKNYILRIAGKAGVPVAIPRISGGLLFWRSTDEDLQQAHEIATRLQTPQRRGKTSPRRRGRQRNTPRR
jgi:hypothetical protein